MEKLIFLDVDGVLNSQKYFSKIKGDMSVDQTRRFFDPEAVKNLNDITDKTGAKIVISSTWRKTRTLEELQELFKEVGITGEVIGKTPQLYFKGPNGGSRSVPRGVEIKEWLEQNGIKPHLFRSYVIIDDDSDMLYNQRMNFFNTDWDFGLGPSMAYRIINYFKSFE